MDNLTYMNLSKEFLVRKYILLLWGLVLSFPYLGAQQEVLTITSELLEETSQYNLDGLDYWQWKSGHDPSWAFDSINTASWQNLNPQELSEDFADEQGRVEGWFRLKVQLDPALQGQQFYFKKWSRDACELFINGQLAMTYGEIHSDKQLTKTYSNSGLLPRRVDFEDGVNTIAIHVVDYTAMFPARLRSRLAGSVPFLAIVSQNYYDNRAAYWQRNPVYKAIWFTVCILLVLLFWFLVYRNPGEINLKLVAICSSLLFLVLLLFSFNDIKGLSIGKYRFAMSGFFFSLFCTLAYIPLMVSLIFTSRIERWVRMTAMGMVLFGAFNVLVLYHILPMGICILTCFAICVYLVVRHRHELQGAQWAIVAGILSTITFLVGLFGMLTLAQSDAPSMASKLDLVTTGVFLSLPLAMLIYVAMRFQEMIRDVQEKAEELIQVGQEKATILANQNTLLEQEVQARTRDLKASMDHLKSTQAQLIHAEKMASLGELTAGIAHEIQNPLNFVNNFSDVSGELLSEVEEELADGNIDVAGEIITDIKENLSKINQHGGRASSIVKGMLDHSRTSSGEKEPTDINSLCEEYMRLAYHGFRAKDKNQPGRQAGFNAAFSLDLDKSIPPISVIPQDIGRVILNLINNAFYTVAEKVKAQDSNSKFNPEVMVSTKLSPAGPMLTGASVGREGLPAGQAGGGSADVIIQVQDNGQGMAPEIAEKVFQPFFTTKPTGEGTGLGLSLSYDIVTKGHSGTLTVVSEEGAGTVFTIKLPTVLPEHDPSNK